MESYSHAVNKVGGKSSTLVPGTALRRDGLQSAGWANIPGSPRFARLPTEGLRCGKAATKILLFLLLDSEQGERKRKRTRTIKFARPATIPKDTNRLKVCATQIQRNPSLR
jgi:hypothetical protein